MAITHRLRARVRDRERRREAGGGGAGEKKILRWTSISTPLFHLDYLSCCDCERLITLQGVSSCFSLGNWHSDTDLGKRGWRIGVLSHVHCTWSGEDNITSVSSPLLSAAADVGDVVKKVHIVSTAQDRPRMNESWMKTKERESKDSVWLWVLSELSREDISPRVGQLRSKIPGRLRRRKQISCFTFCLYRLNVQ